MAFDTARSSYPLGPILLGLFILLIVHPSAAWAETRGLGFIIGDKGETRKVRLHTRKVPAFGKGFPFIERPVAVSIAESISEKEVARIILDNRICEWISYDAYPLDAKRIVLNGHGNKGRNNFIAVWDWRGNSLRIYNNAGSGSPESISGISPDEKWAIAVPSNRSSGLLFHDLEHETSTHMYDGLTVLSPRFSPDGSRWAFFSGNELIICPTKGGDEKRAAIPVTGNWRYGRHLAWSPSGSKIAGIIHHNRTDLVVWDPDGKQLKIVGVPDGVASSWPPVWSADEKGVYIIHGYEGLAGKWRTLQARFVPLW